MTGDVQPIDEVSTYEFVEKILEFAEEYDTKIIGGLVGTFHSFRELQKLDTINSIQLNYLRLLFTISENYITVLAVDPDQTDEYYFKVVRSLLDCLDLVSKSTSYDESEDNFYGLKVTIQTIFSLISDNFQVEILYPSADKERIIETSKIEISEMLKEIYDSHEKFFKRVIL